MTQKVSLSELSLPALSEPFPSVRFFEKVDAGVYRIGGEEQKGTTYKLIEIQEKRRRELFQFTVYMDFVGSISDYRLGFISQGSWGKTGVSLGNSTENLKRVEFNRSVREAAISPDGNFFMLVFEGEENNFCIRTKEGKVVGHDSKAIDYPRPQFGFLDNRTYYSFNQRLESVTIGRLENFGGGNAQNSETGSNFFFPLENGYFVARSETGENILGLFRVPQEGAIPSEVQDMEVFKLPMYENIENPGGIPHESLLDLLEKAMEGNEAYEDPYGYEEYDEEYEREEEEQEEENEENGPKQPVSKVRKRLEREAPATLYQMYYEYWLPEFGARAIEFQMAGNFIAGAYEAPRW